MPRDNGYGKQHDDRSLFVGGPCSLYSRFILLIVYAIIKQRTFECDAEAGTVKSFMKKKRQNMEPQRAPRNVRVKPKHSELIYQ